VARSNRNRAGALHHDDFLVGRQLTRRGLQGFEQFANPRVARGLVLQFGESGLLRRALFGRARRQVYLFVPREQVRHRAEVWTRFRCAMSSANTDSFDMSRSLPRRQTQEEQIPAGNKFERIFKSRLSF